MRLFPLSMEKPKRKSVFALLATAIIVVCGHLAEAQQPAKVYRIGILSSKQNRALEAFRQKISELGWIEGQNASFEHRWLKSNADDFPALVNELLRVKVDIILATSLQSALAAQQLTRTIPIVVTAIDNPVGSGLVKSLGHPGGNLTGLSFMSPQLQGKRLELLRETIPGLSRVAVLSNSVNSVPDKNFPVNLQRVARPLGVQLQILYVQEPDDFKNVFESMVKHRNGAFTLLTQSFFVRNASRIVPLAVKFRLPAIYYRSEFVEAGGLMSYGANHADLYRRAAVFVDKILRGAKPSDLPVEQPTKFELVINLKAAEKIGITIPDKVLRWADEVIR